VIRLSVPCKLEYRDLALRVVAGACKLVLPRRATDPKPPEGDFDAEVVTAFGEAFTNVVLHGDNPPGAEVEIEIETDSDRLTVRLRDHGKPFDLAAVPPPDLDKFPESGLGLYVMKSWMDEVRYERGEAGAQRRPNVLSMTKRLGDFSRADDGDATVLRIDGVLDALSVPNIRKTIDALVAEKRREITVDLSGLRLIDSSGVGVIVSLYKRSKAYGGTVRLAGLKDQPLAIFKLLRLDRVFGLA
jgi:serine/threonine-protein kinase RsbW